MLENLKFFMTFINSCASLHCFICLVSVISAIIFKIMDNKLKFSQKLQFCFNSAWNGYKSGQADPDRRGSLDADPNPAKWCYNSDHIRITTLLLVVLLCACLRGVMSSKVSQSQIWLLGPSTKRRSLRVELAFVVSARGYRNSSTSGLGVGRSMLHAWFKAGLRIRIRIQEGKNDPQK